MEVRLLSLRLEGEQKLRQYAGGLPLRSAGTVDRLVCGRIYMFVFYWIWFGVGGAVWFGGAVVQWWCQGIIIYIV